MATKARVTETIENYLEAVYNMHDEGKRVIGARLAERLGVKPPTVSQTLKRMARDGLVRTHDGEITLTKHGVDVAEATIRRHRVVERFMSDVLGIEWAVAHREAEALQHAMSDLIEQKMIQVLGHPTTCPHGNPIPGMQPTKLPPDALTLDTAAPAQQVQILRITEEGERDPRLLDYLQKEGMMPGASVMVQDIARWNGVVTLKKDEQSIALGLKAARTIWVRPIRQI